MTTNNNNNNTNDFTHLVGEMPLLNGEQLMAPNIVNVGWKHGQIFNEQDDPDRTQTPWAIPSFIVDDKEKKTENDTNNAIIVEELPIDTIPRLKRYNNFARVVHNVFNEEQCAELLKCVNQKGFTPALLNIGGGQQMFAPDVRDGHRVIVDSPELSNYLFQILRPFLPDTYEGYPLTGLNERMRILCYKPGQQFNLHQDGTYIRPPGHPNAGDRSCVTIQLYFHNVPIANGGATTFMDFNPHGFGFGGRHRVPYQPQAGSVLLFSQDLPHEGSLVRKGIKYTLRTEAMYSSSRSTK